MKINITNLVTSFLIILFCTTRVWGVNLPWYINLGVRLATIVFLTISNNLIIRVEKKVIKIIKITIIPIILIVAYSCALWIFSGDIPPINVIRNLFTTNTYLVIDIIFAMMIYNRYKENSVDLFVKYGFISYLICSIIPMIIHFPFEGLKYLFTAYSNNYDLLYYTEVNDLTFGIGICLLYYLFVDNRNNKLKKKNIIKCLLMIFWGLKRIQIAALILCCIFFKVIISKVNIKKASLIATIIVLIVSYSYVMFIHNSSLIQLASEYNINFMGRLPTYEYVANTYSEFTPKFLGIGFGYIDEILDELVKNNFRINYIPIISLHSDILRMYIGIGFLAFGMWIIYQCYTKTKLLYKHVNLNCAKSYLIFTIYLFVLYLTDNTYSYPITFTLYILCTLCSSSGQKKLNDNSKKNK